MKFSHLTRNEMIRKRLQTELTRVVGVSELKSTIQTIRNAFDIKEASDCSRRCPRHCHQLAITPRLAGSARTPQNRSSRIPRHPRLEVLISDPLPVFSETQQYDFGKMIAEMLGNLSFLVGVSLVALYDWLIGLLLWVFGKLPFIPAMPPLIKNEIYMYEVCSCAETEEERRHSIKDTMDDSETFLAASFRQHRRASMLRSFNPHEGTHARRRRAMTLNRFPVIEVRSSAMDTVARTFPTEEEESAERVQPSHSSVDRIQSRLGEEGSSQTLSGKESRARRRSEAATMPVRSLGSVKSSQGEVPKSVQSGAKLRAVQSAAAEQKSAPSVAAESGRRDSAVVVSAARKSSALLRKSSGGKVAPAAAAPVVEESGERQRTAILPSIAAPAARGPPSAAAPGPARPRAAVTFDLDDVEKLLGRSESGLRRTAEKEPQKQQQQQEQQQQQPQQPAAGRSAAPQYRSRPHRKPAANVSPSHDPPPSDP